MLISLVEEMTLKWERQLEEAGEGCWTDDMVAKEGTAGERKDLKRCTYIIPSYPTSVAPSRKTAIPLTVGYCVSCGGLMLTFSLTFVFFPTRPCLNILFWICLRRASSSLPQIFPASCNPYISGALFLDRPTGV